MTRKEAIIKADVDFKKELEEIRIERIKHGKDGFVVGDRRLTKAMIRSSKWPEIKKILIEAEIEDDRWK